MADNLKFLEREILNKVLNAGEDALNVDLTAGGSAMLVDDAAFTPGTSTVQMVGAEFDDTGPDSVDEGDAGAIRMSANRNLYTTIRDAAGNERGVNVNSSSQLLVDGSGVTQPVSGTVSVSGLLADGHAVTIDNTDSNEVYVRGSGTAGSADAKVLTVQGIASGTALAVTESSPISGFATSANQSTIIGHVDGVETLLGTIDSDTDAIKTATESSNTHLGNMFYDTVVSVTPHDTNPISAGPVTYYALWVGTGGNVKVTLAGSGTQTFNNVASGQLLPIVVTHVFSTNTTASNILALK